MTSEQIVRDAIDSMCFNCAKRLLHFQLFTHTSTSSSSSYFWIMKYLEDKKKKESESAPVGCGICFGLLEKYSQPVYLEQVFHISNLSKKNLFILIF